MQVVKYVCSSSDVSREDWTSVENVKNNSVILIWKFCEIECVRKEGLNEC